MGVCNDICVFFCLSGCLSIELCMHMGHCSQYIVLHGQNVGKRVVLYVCFVGRTGVLPLGWSSRESNPTVGSIASIATPY